MSEIPVGVPVGAPTIVTGGAVVSAWWDVGGLLHVWVSIDEVPDSQLVGGEVPMEISIGDNRIFPPVEEDDFDDEL